MQIQNIMILYNICLTNRTKNIFLTTNTNIFGLNKKGEYKYEYICGDNKG